MAILDKIQGQSRININEVISILKEELNITENRIKKLHYSLYATLQLILNKTNRNYIIEDMFTLWVDMTKDYWILNGYDKIDCSSENEKSKQNNNVKVKSVERGDVKVDFRESNNETTINGITYKTGTIEYDDDLLLNKYIKRLYKFRLLGSRRRCL